MKKKFIKRAIPAEISEKGGAYVQFVEKDTVPLDGVIVDAIDGSYCQGRPTLILADKVTSNISRIDIAEDALAELASEEYDGKTIVFTVRGNFSSAKISATLKYAAPEPVAESSDGVVKVMAVEPEAAESGSTFRISGSGLAVHGEEWGIMTITSSTTEGEEHPINVSVVSQADDEVVLRLPDEATFDPGSHPAALWLIYQPQHGAPETVRVPYTFVLKA